MVDNNTTYAAGNQLSLAGATFSVSEGAGSGLDADLLDGQHGTFYRNASNLNAGTLNTARFSAYADLSAEGYLGNASGDLARNNGTLQSNLNVDRLDGHTPVLSLTPLIIILERLGLALAHQG